MSRENVTDDITNEQTDATDIEAEYLALLSSETPDLWAKIEEGLDACDAEKKKRSRRKYVSVIAGLAAVAAVAAVLMLSQMMPSGRTKRTVSDGESDSAGYNQAETAENYDDAMPEMTEMEADTEQAEGDVSYDDAAEMEADNEQAEWDVSYDDAAETNEIVADNVQTDSAEAAPLVSDARLTVQETEVADGGFICTVTVTEISENTYGIQAGDELRIICDTGLEAGTDISCDIAAFDEELNAYVVINKYFP